MSNITVGLVDDGWVILLLVGWMMDITVGLVDDG